MQNRNLLWYEKPAEVWTEALPLGNGKLGAMVYGTPGVEQIQRTYHPGVREIIFLTFLPQKEVDCLHEALEN